MKTNYFPDATGINTNLLVNNPITDPAVLDIVYNDPYYGLGNAANYDRWQVLQSSNVNTTEINKKIAFQSELRTYFQLDSAQV
jgi:hypothetical protein